MSERCETCVHWDIANANPYSTHHYRWSDDDKKLVEKPPHANFKWATCSATLEGWTEEFDAGRHKAAVWDGSEYHASLLTRFDFGCTEYVARDNVPTPPVAEVD